jgi:hypothetical protein
MGPAPGEAPLLPACRGPAVAVEGLEGLVQGDLVVPTLQLKQAQTRDDHELGIADVPDGDWFLTHDPEEAVGRAREAEPGAPRTRRVVFLEVRAGRSFLLPYEEDERAAMLRWLGLLDVAADDVNVVCSSLDRLAPAPPREDQRWAPFAPSCRDCPHSRWTTGESGRRRPPACGETYRALVVDRTDGQETPARMFFRSTAIRPVRALLTALAIAARRHRCPAFGLEVELASRLTRGKKGTYHVPSFARPRPLGDDELVETFRAVREGLLGEVDRADEPAAPAEEDG